MTGSKVQLCLLLFCVGFAQASALTFKPRELFRIPFGENRVDLGAKIENGNFIIPRDFTMDADGHFYIYDLNNHRIARFSSSGRFEIGFRYPATAEKVFAHADAHENLWLLVSDPSRGMFYGIYDAKGKPLKSGTFAQFNRFRLHLDDAYTLHAILSSSKNPAAEQTYILDENNLLLKREFIARPPETHHEVKKSDHTYFIDQVPDGSKEDAQHVNRITDETHHPVADIQGTVVYVTDRGEVYARAGKRQINVYDVDGSLLAKIPLQGLSSACAALRFDAYGNIYELDGIPDQIDQKDEDLRYTPAMTGMRLLQWERE